MTEWRIGAIPMQTRDGPVEIAGWVNERFGLDWQFMTDDDGDVFGVWNVSHLATGYRVCRLHCSMAEAQHFVALLEGARPWEMTDPATARQFAEDFALTRDEFGSERVHRGNVGGGEPWMVAK